MLVAALLPRWVISFFGFVFAKAKTKNKTQKKFCAMWAKRRHEWLGGGEAKDVRAMQWKLFYAVLGNPNSCLCRFVALSLSSHSSLFLSVRVRMCVSVCVGVFHCQSHLFITTTMMPRPPDAKTPVGIGFKTSPFQKKKTKQSYFLATLLALLFCIFLIISPCRIIVRHIKTNLYLHKYFPCISLSFFRFEHSFSLEILRRVNLESFFLS